MRRQFLRGRVLALSVLLGVAMVCPDVRAQWENVGAAGFSAGTATFTSFALAGLHAQAETTIAGSVAGGGTPVNSSDGGDNLLQFTSGGHVLGFNSDGVIVGSASHMLKTEFVNANAVTRGG